MAIETQSVNGFTWGIKPIDEALVSVFSHGLSDIISRLLILRDIKHQDAQNFLKPTLRESLPDPFHLLDMEKAAEIISNSIIAKEKIVIFGDYDVDGATSSALLKRFFSLLNVDAQIYIPDRIGEGYGPSVEAFQYLKAQGADVIITVDCGTAAFEAIDYGVNNGLKIIVIDHHLSGEDLPKAHALVNPNRFDETSDLKYLAAVGVAFLLAVAVNSILRKKNFFTKMQEPSLLMLLDIVAIGTICDVVPLLDLNRAFVVQGLKILNKKTNPGVVAFCQMLNLEAELNVYHLGYVIGPRINAGGRVGKSDLGARLLSTDNLEEALEIAKLLELYNQERRAIEFNVYEQALEMAKAQSPDDALILIGGKNWHPGVVGIVAGRLKEMFNKPVAVLSFLDGKGKASCRSIHGIDFGSAIVKAKEEGLLLTGGGHKMAAGFTVDLEKLPELKSFLHIKFTEELSLMQNRDYRYFDAYLSTSAVNLDFAKEIEQIGPFGAANPEPRFLLKDVYITRSDIFATSHISCFISCATSRDLNKLLKANAFRSVDTELGNALLQAKDKPCSLVGYIRINRWRGKEVAEFIIEDLIF